MVARHVDKGGEYPIILGFRSEDGFAVRRKVMGDEF
jgi:hypothetical protein